MPTLQSEMQAGERSDAIIGPLLAKSGSANYKSLFSKQSLPSQLPQTPQPGVIDHSVPGTQLQEAIPID